MLATAIIPGYTLTEVIHEGVNTVLYRGRSLIKDHPVILKLLKAEYPTLEQITRLKHEYTLRQALNLEGVVTVYALVRYENRLAIVGEDFGGISLKQAIAQQPPSLSAFLAIASQLARTLALLHQQHIIHKDIKPANIIINPSTGQVKLTDFGIASRLSQEMPQLTHPTQLEGTLEYMSPEQTGRMNRCLDYRSDFYSLGVTFYELLTGQLPFQSTDALELVHCHIARSPIPLHQLNPAVPLPIVQMVDKLMAKNAEARYQSAAGLLADLELCQQQLQATGDIRDLTPGKLDVLGQLLIPQTLYGREAQVEQLLAAFDRVSQGSSELVLISGYSGIGKSSVVKEVSKPITRHRGYFVAGKLDQFQRDIPYAPFLQALRSLIQQVLTERAADLERWHTQLMAVLGNNARLMLEVLPELEPILGPQPPVPRLSRAETQTRFRQVFKDLIQVFGQPQHPLVIFLDDLQWADSATLHLIQLLLADRDRAAVLLIGSYRDHEVSPTHPLMTMLEALQHFKAPVQEIELHPLGLTDTTQLLTETLRSCDRLPALAELLWNKTGGNPLFLTQLLQSLYQDQLLTFDFNRACWQWNLEEIQAIGITDLSVVELVASRIARLPQTTQGLLKLAACLGDHFTLNSLSAAQQASPTVTASQLDPALQAGLILPLTEAYRIPLVLGTEDENTFGLDSTPISYKFLHDRVQQAAYSLIPADQKPVTHLHIGRLLLQHTPAVDREDRIFDIVNQFNRGLALLTTQTEKDTLAELNLLAGRKAKAAVAYEPALHYLQVGLELLGDDRWQTQYDLTLALSLETSEAEYLNIHFAAAEQLANEVLQQATSPLDRAQAFELKIQLAIAQGQMFQAIDLGQQALTSLGVELSEAEESASGSEPWALPSLAELEAMPVMTAPDRLAALRLLTAIIAPAFNARPELLPLILSRSLQLCAQYGRSPLAALAYGWHGVFLCGKLDIEAGYHAGQLALKLVELFDDRELKCPVYNLFNAFIRHWKHPAKDSIAPLLEALHSGLETGDIDWASYCAVNYCTYPLMSGESLELVENRQAKYIELLLQLKQEHSITYLQIWQQLGANLLGRTEDPCRLVGDCFNEDEMLPQLQQGDDLTALLGVYLAKAILCYRFNQHEHALEYITAATQYGAAVTGLMVFALHNFYQSLILLAQYPQVEPWQQRAFLQQVHANQEKMRLWAHHAPMNYQHKYYLVEAEKARVLNDRLVAMDLYDLAIQGAVAHGYVQEEALANERAAEFYLALGKEKIARVYLTDAYYSHIRWGAIAKVKHLEERYAPFILCSDAGGASTGSGNPTASSGSQSADTSSPEAGRLDLATVMKAAEAIASEIVLDTLLRKLLQIVLENAAAQKGCLILAKAEQLFIEAAATDQHESAVVLQSTPIEASPDVPLSLIHYVARTQQPVVLSDATQDPLTQTDPYILRQQPKSVLCSPIFYQGKFIGLVYLENNLTPGAFTPDRLELLTLLTAQAAIAIENARLYAREQERLQQLEQSLCQLQQTQAQLVQTEKISSLGQLVAGIAHEVNNPVGFISGNLNYASQYVQDLSHLLQLYRQYLPTPPAEVAEKIEDIDLEYLLTDLPKMISSMKLGIDRIRDIMQSLRNFSRTDGSEKKAVDIHEGLDTTLMILQHRLKAKPDCPAIQVIKKYGDLPKVECYAGQLNQVFMNLLSNAIDALEEANQHKTPAEQAQYPGVITIRTEVVTAAEPSSLPEQSDPGSNSLAPTVSTPAVVIRIADNGPGICESTRQHLFVPFFTTKPEGKGTGLGLSISAQIITDKHGGTLQCLSAPGQGTEFVIQLPLTSVNLVC